MVKKLGYILGGICLVIIIVSVLGYYYFVKAPLPKTEGELTLPGLKESVEVIRDRWGVPHIYARSNHDLLFAQGFIQAQDRLWQMDINRRLASGRMSEILGQKTLPLDRLARTLGILRAAQAEIKSYDPNTLKLLEAFSSGVNAFIKSRGDKLPLEFRLLGARPEPWLPEHSIAWAKLMALLGGKNWQEEMVGSLLRQRLGPEKAQALLAHNRPGTPHIIPKGIDMASLIPSTEIHDHGFRPSLGGGSNSWAVDGSRTVTESPLLANDMHLALRIPSAWYEMHLSGGDFDVTGLSLAGVPLVIAGHNRDMAWGITFAYTDVQDVFLERMDPENPGHYLYKGKWVKARLIEENIRVKDQEEPFVHKTWVTRHGPIITPYFSNTKSGEYSIALKWSAHEPGGMLPALRDLNLSSHWRSFRDAAQRWPEPTINLVFADRKGNIGYALAGRIPLRPQGHGMGPFPGWTGEYDWEGYLVPEKKPFVLNPERGFMVTANNRVAGPNFPHYLGSDYAPGYRAARVTEVLLSGDRLSMEDFAQLQSDRKSLPAAPFIESIKGVLKKDPTGHELIKRLETWDHVLDPGSVGGAIYSVLFYRLMENTFLDELGNTTERFFGSGFLYFTPLSRYVGHSRVILRELVRHPQSPWFDDTTTKRREDLSDILEKSLKETAAFLEQKLGPDPSQWRWGRLHRVEISHPLGRVKPLDRIFNLGPFEGGGDFSTVWQSALKPGMNFALNGWTVSHRHIYDPGDWDRSVGSIVPGQSGMLGSPHYSDQMEMWLNVEHHPLSFTRRAVESHAERYLTLKP